MQRNTNSSFRPMVESLENREVLTANLVATFTGPVLMGPPTSVSGTQVVQAVSGVTLNTTSLQLVNGVSEQSAITWNSGPTMAFESGLEATSELPSESVHLSGPTSTTILDAAFTDMQ